MKENGLGAARTLCVRVKPVAVSVYTTSVKVPPTSTPTSFSAFSSAARAPTSTRGDVRPPCTARLVLFGKESNPGRNPTAPEGVPLLGDAPGRPVGRDNLNPRHGLGGAANAAPHLHRALGFRSSASSANTGADLCSKVFATSVSSSCPALTWQRRNQEPGGEIPRKRRAFCVFFSHNRVT